MHHDRPRAPGKFLLILTGVALWASAVPARAEDKKPDSSLALIPADAAYYGAMLRNREQIDAVAKSKAWAKIKNLPLVQMAWGMLEKEYSAEGKLAPLREWMGQAENSELIVCVLATILPMPSATVRCVVCAPSPGATPALHCCARSIRMLARLSSA